MNIRELLVLSASILAASVPGPAVAGPAVADDMQRLYLQEAEIEIDPAQLEAYKAAVSEQIETATRVEPGVLALYAVSEKDNPTHVRVFENLSGRGCLPAASGNRAFQEIQDNDGEHGQLR